MKILRTLQEDLAFYVEDLFDYVQVLKKSTNDIEFIESFEKKMKSGLRLLLEKTEYHDLLNKIRNPNTGLLKQNKERFIAAILKDKGEIDPHKLNSLIKELQKTPLLHATKNKQLLIKNGISTAANLWKSRIKTCANAMDIALGLHFYYSFFSHGFILSNFSEDFVEISNGNLKNAIVSTVDIYKIVLIKNNLDNKGIIPTEKWLIALEDYSKQLFNGEDFFELKANYIFAYFDGDIEKYNEYARNSFYSKDISLSPPDEYPFLGEIKVFGNINPSNIILENL